ncbi:MAG: aldo/keto reductase [Rhodothermales bacterium]|nr:aldo/keto reductase [Rhodothermales bacterium]
MDTRRIGSLRVSAVGLGCNNFGWHIDEAASREVIHAALDAGITHFDTAAAYGDGESERILGRALGGRRAGVVIATKFGNRTSTAPDAVKAQCEDSLRRLGTDRIDLFYLHKPNAETPIADTLGALDDLVREGKVREIACSNLSPEQLREADRAAGDGARFVALQNEYSLLHRAPEAGTLQACEERGLAFVPFFPLKSGLLTGKYRRGAAAPAGSRLSGREGSYFADYRDRVLTEENLEAVERLIGFAERRGHTVLELAFSWLLARPAVASVIAGATKPEQVRANVAAAGWRLTEADLAALDEAVPARSVA